MEDIESKINSYSKRWVDKVPKKFNPRLISDIHQYLSAKDEEGVLAQLDDLKYFSKVLWPFFEKDVSESHLELILMSCIFSMRRGDSKVVFEMIESGDKFDDFLERVLQSTVAVDGSRNLRIGSSCLQFLGDLVSMCKVKPILSDLYLDIFGPRIFDSISEGLELREAMKSRGIAIRKSHDDFKERSLRNKWAPSLFRNLVKLIDEEKYREVQQKNEEFKRHFCQLLESFIYMCVNCASSLDNGSSLFALIEAYGIIPLISSFGGASHILRDSVFDLERIIHLHIKDADMIEKINSGGGFGVLQTTIFRKYGEQEIAREILSIPSVYNVSEAKLTEMLNVFTLEDIRVFAKALGHLFLFLEVFQNKNFLIRIVNHDLYRHSSSIFNLIKAFDEVNEDYIDNFYDLSGIDSCIRYPLLHPTNCVTYKSPYDFLFREVRQTYYHNAISNLKHIKSVLKRVQMVESKTGELVLKGKSKYLGIVSEQKLLPNSRAEVIVKNSGDWNDVHPGHRLFFVGLVKLNKYSPHKRIKELGLDLLRSVQVGSISGSEGSKKIVFSYDFNDEDQVFDRAKYLVRIPPNHLVRSSISYISQSLSAGELRIPGLLKSVFDCTPEIVSKETGRSENISFTVEPVSQDNLQSAYRFDEGMSTKRRKTNDRSVVNKPSKFLVQIQDGSNTALITNSFVSNLDFVLDEFQTEALIKCLESDVVLINSPKHTGAKVLINSIIHNINVNYPNSRVLIIVPNSETKKSFDVDRLISYGVIKYDDHYADQFIEKISQKSKVHLEKVSEFARKMKLDQFDFSSNCKNALSLYKSHIYPQWRTFWFSVKEDENNIDRYPLLSLTDLTLEGDFSDKASAIVDSYLKVVAIFEQLQIFEPLLNFKGKAPQIKDYLAKRYGRVIVASAEDIIMNPHIFSSDFDVIISHKVSEMLPIFVATNNTKARKLVLFHDESQYSPQQSLAKKMVANCFPYAQINKFRGVNQVLAKHFHNPQVTENANGKQSLFNPGFLNTCQVIETHSKTPDPVSQAELACALWRYMCHIGYPSHKIAVVGFSQLQVVLLHEVFSKRSTGDHTLSPVILLATDISSYDYIIATTVDCELYLPLRQVALCSRKGLYLIGPTSRLPQIPHEPLTLVKNETYTSTPAAKRNTSKVIRVNSSHDIDKYLSSASPT